MQVCVCKVYPDAMQCNFVNDFWCYLVQVCEVVEECGLSTTVKSFVFLLLDKLHVLPRRDDKTHSLYSTDTLTL